MPMILASLNGTPGFGFTEAIAQRDGSLWRTGRLTISLPAETRLQLLISQNELMTYSGPVWENGAWRDDAFPVLVRPVAFLTERLTMVSVVEATSRLRYPGAIRYSTNPAG